MSSTAQETDVSIAREVDKDLDAENGPNGENDAGESASARHAAREKQREVWGGGGIPIKQKGACHE